MKVLDLACAQGHVFEGWFSTEEDYAQQRERGLLSCPMCGEVKVEKKLSAPRLNLKSAGLKEPQSSPKPADSPQPQHVAKGAELQSAYMHMVRELMSKTEDVGEHFASEARAMHLGELPERAIRGQTSAEEAQALADEGIAVMQLAVPEFAKQPLQ